MVKPFARALRFKFHREHLIDLSARPAYLLAAARDNRVKHRSLCFLHATLSIGEDMAKKRSKRRQWTKDDLRELKASAKQKTPARKIARTLKRTEGATRQKAFSLGISLDSRS
ncbi:MAG: hypothetical protein E6G96_00515 [Alphaproteobacteria bacterium]|nr:MAG: hypothetical protein E6G96_00515 [Alphaproteobacteria bacterium]